MEIEFRKVTIEDDREWKVD